MVDFLIRNGVVVDGEGGEPRVADVAVSQGRIVAVAPDLDVAAKETFDARGMIVTPGFIDVHTHYDGQVTWDEAMLPSSAHGVTTVVTGSCGIGFAPVRPGTQDWLVNLMEGVEDIPGSALHEGLPWTWESFPEYLDILAGRTFALDVACQAPHSAIRAYVLGKRAETDEPATAEDLAAIKDIVRDAIAAGAVGVGTSRIVIHRGSGGELLPGTDAAEAELLAISEAMREAGGGILQMIPSGVTGGVEGQEGAAMIAGIGRCDRHRLSDEVEMMRRLHRATGQKVTFSVSESRALGAEEFALMRESIADAARKGEQVYPQFSPRSIGTLSCLAGYHPFAARPSYLAIADLPLAERRARMRDPELKARILAEEDVPTPPGNPMLSFHKTLQSQLSEIYVLEGVDYEPDPSTSVAERARAAGREPLDVAYDLLLEDDGHAVLVWLATNYVGGDLNSTAEILRDPRYIIGLGDAGAHVRVICDASYPTFMLAHWGRDRRRGPTLPVQDLVRKMTRDPAEVYGFHDRGIIVPGKRADLNVIDLARLNAGRPYLKADLPSGAERFLQDSQGYAMTMVAGVVTRRDDQDTGARPGRLVRAGRAAAAA